MKTTRRDFLRLGIGTSTLLACGAGAPLFLARSASAMGAEPEAQSKGRILVVVQLDGGNDGLNTVVPFNDDEYKKARPTLAISADRVRRINNRVGFHPALGGFSQLLEAEQLAVVQGVGYPNPNRSHFESMAIWHTAEPRPTFETTGWLSRALDTRSATQGGDVPALHVAEAQLPQAFSGGRHRIPSLENLQQFRRRLGLPAAIADAQRTALDEVVARRRGEPGSLLDFVQQNTAGTYTISARLERVLADGNADASPLLLGRRLGLIAKLIKAELTTSIYYTQLGGFDTHGQQENTHYNLLQQLNLALGSFVGELKEAGELDRVLVLVFSEFGRRLNENGSGGTDHGTAAPVFLVGGGVKAGVHGPYPDLQNLADGDPRHAIDFRRVYATVLEDWLGIPARVVLGRAFEKLELLSV
jgi:uncharacterized protein (DUF1501 family)